MIDSLKDLEKLVKVMRKTGISKIKIEGIELELSSIAVPATKQPKLAVGEEHTFVPGGIDADTKIDTPDELTEEQLLNWSSAPGGVHMGPGEV